LLRTYQVAQVEARLAAGPLWRDQDGLVFTTPLGTPIDPDNFRHRLGHLMECAGVGKWTTHELRHSTGSLLYAMGLDMRVISEVLGHSSERVTSDVYVHLMRQHRAAAADAIT
jgi:integrase